MVTEKKDRGGLVDGGEETSHDNGGVKFPLDGSSTIIEEEGLEVNIPVEITNLPGKYKFTGSNFYVLNEILKLGKESSLGKELSLASTVSQVRSKDIVICKRSVWDSTIRTYEGTILQILSAINESGECNHIESGAKIIDHNTNELKNPKMGKGGDTNDFANSGKSRIFIPTKITKDELQSILSGKSKISNGDTIQSTLSYIRREEGANSINRGTKSEIEKERLIEFIDKNNLWYLSELTPPDGLGRGGEHIVYEDPTDKDFILKTNNLHLYGGWSDYLVNLLLNNTFFPDTSYELIGFKKDEQGNILPVVRQYFVPLATIADLKDVQKYLFNRGFMKIHPLVNAYRNWDLGVMLGDLHERNVLLKDNTLFFIDTKFFLSHNADYVYKDGGQALADETSLNDKGGYDYSGEAKKIAKTAGLVTLPKSIPGTNCGNCIFFSKGFCKHYKVLLPITSRQCCSFWDEKSFGSAIVNIWDAYLFPDKSESKFELNALGGYDYSGKALERAREADLITLPENIVGTSCAQKNCMYRKDNMCIHPRIGLPVTDRMSCGWWNNQDVVRSWGEPIELEFNRGGKISLKDELKNWQIVNPNSPRWKKKKNQIVEISNNIHKIRLNVSRDLSSDDEKTFLTALAVAIMDKTGERVGNEGSASEGHFGVTGFTTDHVKVVGNKIILDYKGKSGVDHEKSFTDSRIAKALKKAIKNSPKEINGKQNKFIFVTSDGFKIKNDKVDRYLKDFDITPKVIRGYFANSWLVKKLSALPIEDTEKKRKKVFNNAVKQVAKLVGHNPPTLKKHYMIPELPIWYINKGKIINIKNLGYYRDGGELGDIPISKYFKNKNEVPDEVNKQIAELYKQAEEKDNGIIELFQELPVEEVDFDDLVPTQDTLRSEKFKKLDLLGKDIDTINLPHLIKYNGKSYILDGHHRTVKTYLVHKPIKGHIYNMKSQKENEQLKKGIEVEKEHRNLYIEIKKRLDDIGVEMPITENEFYTEIAKAHIKEKKDYYDLLEKYVEKYSNKNNMKNNKNLENASYSNAGEILELGVLGAGAIGAGIIVKYYDKLVEAIVTIKEELADTGPSKESMLKDLLLGTQDKLQELILHVPSLINHAQSLHLIRGKGGDIKDVSIENIDKLKSETKQLSDEEIMTLYPIFFEGKKIKEANITSDIRKQLAENIFESSKKLDIVEDIAKEGEVKLAKGGKLSALEQKAVDFLKNNKDKEYNQLWNSFDKEFKKEKGFTVDTGGGIVVGIIPVNKRQVIGVGENDVVRYDVKKDNNDPYDIFYDEDAKYTRLYDADDEEMENYWNELSGTDRLKIVTSELYNKYDLSENADEWEYDKLPIEIKKEIRKSFIKTNKMDTGGKIVDWKGKKIGDFFHVAEFPYKGGKEKWFIDAYENTNTKDIALNVYEEYGNSQQPIYYGASSVQKLGWDNSNVPKKVKDEVLKIYEANSNKMSHGGQAGESKQVYWTLPQASPIHAKDTKIIIEKDGEPVKHSHGSYQLWKVYLESPSGDKYWKQVGHSWEKANKRAEDLKDTIEAGYKIKQLSEQRHHGGYTNTQSNNKSYTMKNDIHSEEHKQRLGSKYIGKGVSVTDKERDKKYTISKMDKGGITLEENTSFKNANKDIVPVNYDEFEERFNEGKIDIGGYEHTIPDGIILHQVIQEIVAYHQMGDMNNTINELETEEVTFRDGGVVGTIILSKNGFVKKIKNQYGKNISEVKVDNKTYKWNPSDKTYKWIDGESRLHKEHIPLIKLNKGGATYHGGDDIITETETITEKQFPNEEKIKEQTSRIVDKETYGRHHKPLVEKLLESDVYTPEDIRNQYTIAETPEESLKKDIAEWIMVSDWLAPKLEEQGEVVLITPEGNWWGRSSDNDSLYEDKAIVEISKTNFRYGASTYHKGAEVGYQGWKNYETHNVKLWMDNDSGSHSYWDERTDEIIKTAKKDKYSSKKDVATRTLADELKSYHEDNNPLADQNSTYSDLLQSALDNVDWREIAQNLLSEKMKWNGGKMAGGGAVNGFFTNDGKTFINVAVGKSSPNRKGEVINIEEIDGVKWATVKFRDLEERIKFEDTEKDDKVTSHLYLNIKKLDNGLEISLTKEGKEKVIEMKEDDKTDEYIMSELFDDIQGNSELIFHGDMGESGFGLTQAPGITNEYHHSDEIPGAYETNSPESAEVYWFPGYQVHSFLDDMLEDGKVVFEKAPMMFKGGKADVTPNYYRFRQHSPKGVTECAVPSWGQKVAESVKKGSKITTCKKDGKWFIQSIMIPKEGVKSADAKRFSQEIKDKFTRKKKALGGKAETCTCADIEKTRKGIETLMTIEKNADEKKKYQELLNDLA